MQGRQGQGKDAWDSPSSDPRASLNGTGRQRAIPQRPPGMTRLDTPPATPRVGRPQRQAPPPKSWRRRLLIFGSVIFICGLLVFIITYGVVNFFIGVGSSAGAANVAADFLTNLQSQNYDAAYKDLSASITVSMQPQDFQKMAQADDKCYGPVTNFNEVQGSATVSSDGNQQSYAYDVQRSKLAHSYRLTLTIAKDSSGNWYITNFGNDLGPAPPTC
ncbi:MAG TPA: hypothetical protein VFA41_02840 [Ktedonobacteraceae bacterium]|nr:hypothetical protein [Ktedonobacteraceae bacterium]